MRLRGFIILIVAGMVIGALITYALMKDGNEEPKVEVTHNMIVDKIETLGNLEVVKYNIQDIVEYKKVRQWLPNAKTALVVVGEVIACIDLTKVSAEDIHTSGDSIQLFLPAPEICHIKIDHSKSHIHNTEYGLWESDQIADEAYRFAEKQLYAQALQLDIASKSRDNAVNLLSPILQAMGFNKVTIMFKNDNISSDKRLVK